mmetsp:Transcript_8102/g.18620  ORF Transcript_8102/g.18620 Transcript_8102/m.18620 type:complete len:255 (-) Transcript_8102:1318-2082(-)
MKLIGAVLETPHWGLARHGHRRPGVEAPPRTSDCSASAASAAKVASLGKPRSAPSAGQPSSVAAARCQSAVLSALGRRALRPPGAPPAGARSWRFAAAAWGGSALAAAAPSRPQTGSSGFPAALARSPQTVRCAVQVSTRLPGEGEGPPCGARSGPAGETQIGEPKGQHGALRLHPPPAGLRLAPSLQPPSTPRCDAEPPATPCLSTPMRSSGHLVVLVPSQIQPAIWQPLATAVFGCPGRCPPCESMGVGPLR